MADRMVKALHLYNTGEGATRAEVVDWVRRLEAIERAVVDHVILWDDDVDSPTFMANVEHSVNRLRRLVGSERADVRAGIDPWRMVRRPRGE